MRNDVSGLIFTIAPPFFFLHSAIPQSKQFTTSFFFSFSFSPGSHHAGLLPDEGLRGHAGVGPQRAAPEPGQEGVPGRRRGGRGLRHRHREVPAVPPGGGQAEPAPGGEVTTQSNLRL